MKYGRISVHTHACKHTYTLNNAWEVSTQKLNHGYFLVVGFQFIFHFLKNIAVQKDRFIKSFSQ